MKVIAKVFLSLSICYSFLAQDVQAQNIKGDPFEVPEEGVQPSLISINEFEAPSALAFDSFNRPYMFNSREPESFGFILTLRDDKWMKLSYMDALKKAYPKMQLPKKRFLHALGTITIDESNAIYIVIQVQKAEKHRGYVLLYSPDLNGNFQVYDLPQIAFLEIQTGFNNLSGPPAIGALTFRKKHPAEWTDYYDLSVYFPKKTSNELILGKPIHVSKNCFGVSNHSGGYSFGITTNAKTHIVYAEISEEEDSGNPTYVATIDRKKRQVVAKEFLVSAPPKNPDVHSTPVITADSTGRLHVLAGAHGQAFQYLRARVPDSISVNWTDPTFMGELQTYATLFCDPENRLHSVYRVHPKLLYQYKPANDIRWSKPRVLVNPPKRHRGYSIYYHRLFMDAKGALYLSYTFYEQNTKEEGRYPRFLVVSEDSGRSWQSVSTNTFQRRIIPSRENPE